MSNITIYHAGDCEAPEYKTVDAAGCDLVASEVVTIEPSEHVLVSTGLFLAIPQGFEGQVRPRSGLANKHKVTVLNAPGTIDSDYRGEVKVMLINHGKEPYVVLRGERIAQLIIAPVMRATFVRLDELPPTNRGAGGFGSTGS